MSSAENDKHALATWLSHGRERTGAKQWPSGPLYADPSSDSSWKIEFKEEADELWRLYRHLFPEGYKISCKDFQLLKSRCIALCSLLAIPGQRIFESAHQNYLDILSELRSCIQELDQSNHFQNQRSSNVHGTFIMMIKF
jgi:hypothetical protein